MKKNILIVDDSALMRRVISDIIASDNRFIVSDIAVNGLEAFRLVVDNTSKYDAIVCDINMPKMSGLEFLEQIEKYRIKAKVIVVSTVAKEGAKETIRALELGAFDFVTKPDSFVDTKSDSFKNAVLSCLALATKLDAGITTSRSSNTTEPASSAMRTTTPRPVFQRTVPPREPSTKPESTGATTPRSSFGSKGKIRQLVALACSTGGPKALQAVIPHLPANLDASMLLVQHMPEGFTNSLAVRLNEMSPIDVKEADDGDIIKKGCVYVAKGGYQMKLAKQRNGDYKLGVIKDPPRNALRPCADIMYESLLESDFDRITCVVLTGMGSDGTVGIRQLKNMNNIYVIAQNEESSTVYGMPKVVKEAGLVDEVVPLNKVAEAIIKIVGVQ